jgi:hypothetical protein
MSDELPSGDRAWFGFFEIIALAFAFEGVTALLHDESWMTWAPAILGSAVFFAAGVKVPWIRGKLVSVNWGLWGKWINRALGLAVVLSSVAALAAGYYAWRQWADLSRDVPKVFHSPHQASPEVQPPKAQGTPAPTVTRLDWRDKKNWREHLRTGMTETEVYQLFGPPEQVSVVSDSDFWKYGSGGGMGQMTFNKGTLYSWSEPSE